ncbi:hypothetical protein PG993_007834 [Apiospora rasikravindrae]|uniref:Uncharacterized protein n=1 Tax=Apiospora rasikravindrae TaxID=990691 RepID=A0ABR1T0W3_9PEZI
MGANALKRRNIQGRPLSPIVEELVSHYESKCGSSVQDEDADLPENAEEKDQSTCLEDAKPVEQCMELEEGTRLSIDNAATVPIGDKETSPVDVEALAAEESGALLASAKSLASSRTASSEGLPQLSHNNSSVQTIGQWLQIVSSHELDDPELASPFVESCSPRPDLSQLPSPFRSTTDTLDKGKSRESPTSQQGSAASSSEYSHFSEAEEYDSSSGIASSCPSPLKESDLALIRKPSRIISPTPKLRRKKRDVHIHLSLTDSQLEKMASIFASSQSHTGKEPDSPSPERHREYSSYNRAPKTLHHKEGSSSLGIHAHRRMPGEDHGHNKYDFDRQYGPGTDGKSSEGKEEKGERPTTVETNWSAIIRTVKRSPSQDKLSPTKASSRSKIPAPAQKGKRRPMPLNLNDARKYGEIVSHRKNIEVVHNPVPTTPALEGNNSTIVDNNNDASSSVYTSDPPTTSTPPFISPLHITKRTANIGRKLNVLKAYNDYKESTTPNPESALLKTPFRSKSVTASNMKQKEPEVPDTSTVPTTINSPSSPRHSYSQQGSMRPNIPKSATTNDLKRDDGQPEPFTPLTPWLLASSVHIKKNLFGEHGWLKDTSAAEPKPEPQRKSGIFDGLRKVARDLAEKAEFKTTSNRPRSKNVAAAATSPRRQSITKRMTISLDPREQSLLYCELEYTLSNALDIYIKTQLNGGRLDPAKLKKVSDGWAAKGRPRVVGFRYDLETQVELVRLHLYQFRFYHSHYGSYNHQSHETLLGGGGGGGTEDSTAAIDAILYAVKCNARVMRVRSLCQPDSVIAKHVLDAQALLGLLGAAEGMHRALAEVSQFFKVVVERERAVRRTREASIRALPHEVAAAMGHDSNVMSVTQTGDVSFQEQQQQRDKAQQRQGQGKDDGEENYEGPSQVPLQYQQQTMPTTTQRQSAQPHQQKVSFAAVSHSSSAATVAADTSMAEHSEEDQSMVQYVPPPKLSDHQHEQGDDSLVTLSSKAYRAPSHERSFL